MTLLVLGISHRSAPMSLLDALAIDGAQSEALLEKALHGEYVEGATVLATCNRLEIIADVGAFHGGLADLGGTLVKTVGIDWNTLSEHVYVYFDEKAVEHLLTLAAGLDSMAVGEAQILGQLRGAFTRAQEADRLTGHLSDAIQQALRVGKRAHSETRLDSVSQSLLDTSFAAARRHIGPLDRAQALVVGAGAMSGLTVASLHRAGVKRITVINRTLEKAERLAEPVGGRAVALDHDSLVREIGEADLIVSVTGARGTVLGKDLVIEGMQTDLDEQPHKFFVDLALPHDIDPEVGELPYVRLLGLDDLSGLYKKSEAASSADVLEILGQVKGIIAEEMEQIEAGRRAREIAPTLAALRNHAVEVVESEFARLRNKLGDTVDEKALTEIRKTLGRASDKIIHTPTVKVKELVADDSGVDYAAALSALFDLRDRGTGPVDATKLPVDEDGGLPAAVPQQVVDPTADGKRPVADHTLQTVEPPEWNGHTVRLGTRRSQLARSQSIALAQQLARHTGWRVQIVEVVTEGDVNMTPLASLGGTGVFVSAVRTALLTGKVDLVVHSLKDLPTAPAAGIHLGAVPPRVDPADVLIARDGLTLRELPAGSTIGTGSPRRAAQIRALRPDLQVKGVRGNVDTRIRHVTEGSLDAIVLAAAGVRRLGRLDEVTDVLDSAVMLPAPGQGALAVECRAAESDIDANDAMLRTALKSVHDEATALTVLCERAVLSRAEAGCSAPIGAFAELDGRALTLTAVMADDAGRLRRISDVEELPKHSASTGEPEVVLAAKRLGHRVADALLGSLGSVPDTITSNAPESHVATLPEDAQEPAEAPSEVSR
ncbi:glutamyl-tRNA reductase [Brevibacterium litoralis]|uniref:glutamyl-tRNA reductase n=1 Tax=Brevibacterium litoralis TaxID=3138935 RepID=UPI0032EC8128